MFDFNLSRESGTTFLRLNGSVEGGGDLDRLTESFAFVQPNDHLILDLTDVDVIDSAAVMTLRDILFVRAVLSETVVVSTRPEVSLQLVVHDVDRLSPIVCSLDEATAILEERWANRRQVQTRFH
jgi:anti-anti-sigma regulatory factor